jgi:SAM-dependent methyltransferase
VSQTYSNVDGSKNPRRAVADQDRVDSWPQIRQYKQRTYDLLAPAQSVLDVGCGPGGDIVASTAGRVVGVDQSWIMCTAAAARGAKVARGHAEHLPFRDGAFSGTRADRVLQHVDEPAQVLDEMIRVTRPGGTVVVADPDQETLVIHVPGAPRDLVNRVKAFRRDVGYRNGMLASALPAMFADCGLEKITVDPFPLLLKDPDEAFGLPGWVRLGRDSGRGFDDGDVALWDDAMAQARLGGFLYALIYFVVSGSKP